MGMGEAKDFFKPIITPYELTIALQAEPTWTGEYVLDFGTVLDRTSKLGNAIPLSLHLPLSFVSCLLLCITFN
jgi:hypothetical protein